MSNNLVNSFIQTLKIIKNGANITRLMLTLNRMQIVFTNHFWDRWERRKEALLGFGITPGKIKEYVINPDLIVPDPNHKCREWRIKKIQGRCLKIVVEVRRDRLEIITVFFDRTLKRKGLCE